MKPGYGGGGGGIINMAVIAIPNVQLPIITIHIQITDDVGTKESECTNIKTLSDTKTIFQPLVHP